MSSPLKLNAIRNKLDEFLSGAPAKLSRQHKLLVLVAALLVPLVAFAMLVAKPRLEEIDRLEKRVVTLQKELTRLAGLSKDLERHREEMAAVQEQLRVISQLLPEEQEIPLLLTNISNLGTNSGLDFLLFRPQKEVPREFYAEIPVDIAVRGPYHYVGMFLDRISKLPRIVTVKNINMGSPSKSESVMYLNTTFTLLTYRFIESAPQAGAGR